MDYIIHRGQYEIGGMCIEVAADDGTRVLLDLGMPLTAPDGGEFLRGTPQRPTEELIAEGVLRDIPGVYPHDPTAPDVAAIILTHSHLDHYGLAHHAHPDIPVYGSDGTIAILEVGRVFFPEARLPRTLRRFSEGVVGADPPRPGPARDETLRFGALTVTAIPVDHSAPDSRALLVEADGQRLLYTGDLRAHGRTGFRFENLLRDERLHGVDWLLAEGTTLGWSRGAAAGGSGERSGERGGERGGELVPAASTHGLRTEAAVEERLVELACDEENREKLIAVAASGQNVDRLVSCFRAALRSGRQLVIDPYQAYVLMQLAPLSPSIPQFTWERVRVGFTSHQVQRLKEAGLMGLAREMSRQGRVSSDELAGQPGRFLACTRGGSAATRLFDKVGAERVVLVWSMWRGYWEREGCAMREWAERRGESGEGPDVHFVHSGGHAWPQDLERLQRALEPCQTVVVHTNWLLYKAFSAIGWSPLDRKTMTAVEPAAPPAVEDPYRKLDLQQCAELLGYGRDVDPNVISSTEDGRELFVEWINDEVVKHGTWHVRVHAGDMYDMWESMGPG